MEVCGFDILNWPLTLTATLLLSLPKVRDGIAPKTEITFEYIILKPKKGDFIKLLMWAITGDSLYSRVSI